MKVTESKITMINKVKCVLHGSEFKFTDKADNLQRKRIKTFKCDVDTFFS